MPRPTTKAQLEQAAQVNFKKLFTLIDSMSEQIQNEPFAYNERDESLKDVLIHLYEWQLLLLAFIRTNLNKSSDFAPFLPPPYNFKTYPQMNRALKLKHSDTTLERAKALLHASHTESMAIIATLPEQTLFVKKHYKWCGSTSLGSYCVSATSSHYEWALQCIKKRARVDSKKLIQGSSKAERLKRSEYNGCF